MIWYEKASLNINTTMHHCNQKTYCIIDHVLYFILFQKVIDYLKIDIEFNEWECFREMLENRTLQNVKQLGFEIHTSNLVGNPGTKQYFYYWYGILRGLEEIGFRKYHYHVNPYGVYESSWTGKSQSCCYELYYINLHFIT